MNLRFIYWILAFCCLNAALTEAAIPDDIKAHLRRDFNISIRKLNDLRYSDEQVGLVIDRYVDGLTKLYKADRLPNFDRKELFDHIMRHLPGLKAGPKAGPIEPTDVAVLKDVVGRFMTGNVILQKINVPYKGLLIPLFLENDHGIVHISLVGIKLDSTKRTYPFSAYTGRVDGAKTCMDLLYDPKKANETKLEILNVEYEACPFPRGVGGSYLLGLADELAKGLGTSVITADDQSSTRCEKNNETTSLALRSVFRRGKTWYGLHGYSAGDDDAVTNSYRTFPLSVVKAELDGMKDLEANKAQMLKKKDSYLHESIEEDFSKFTALKQMFDREYEDFMSSKGATDRLDQFFNWLWDKDCASYTELVKFLFESQATSGLSLRELKPLPKNISKKLK